MYLRFASVLKVYIITVFVCGGGVRARVCVCVCDHLILNMKADIYLDVKGDTHPGAYSDLIMRTNIVTPYVK